MSLAKGWLLLITAMVCLAGCTGLRYTALTPDPRWEYLFVKDLRSIQLTPGGGAPTRTIYLSSAEILLPRCSPDRTMVAFFELSDRRGALRWVDLAGEVSDERKKWARTVVEIEGPAGERMALFPPIWSPDGRSLLMVDQAGIYEITLEGERKRTMPVQGIVGLTVSPDGSIAYADGKEIAITTIDGRELETFPTTTRAVPEPQEVQPLAFSPDGAYVAYGVGRFVYILDVANMDAREVTEMEDTVYWIQWLPGRGRIVFTTGLPMVNLRTSLSASPYRVEAGSCRLFSVGTDGRGLRRLFENSKMEPVLSEPALSPDGSAVAIVSGTENAPQLLLAGTDSTSVTGPVSVGTSKHPTWLPPLDGDAPCPAFVAYLVR